MDHHWIFRIMFSDASADELDGIFKCLHCIGTVALGAEFQLNAKIESGLSTEESSMIPSFHSINQQKPPVFLLSAPLPSPLAASVSMRRSPRPFDHLLVGTLIANWVMMFRSLWVASENVFSTKCLVNWRCKPKMNVWLLMMCHINSQYSFIWFPRGIPIDLVFLFKLFYTNGICILQGFLVDTFFLLLVVICPPPKLLDRPGWGRMLVPNECAKLLLRRIPGAKWWDGNTYILTLIMHFSQIWWRNFGQFRCIVWGTYCIHGVLVSNIYHFHTIFVVRLSYLTTVIFFETGWNHQLGFGFGWSHLSKVWFLLTIKILKVEARQHKLRQFALPPSFPPPKKGRWSGWGGSLSACLQWGMKAKHRGETTYSLWTLCFFNEISVERANLCQNVHAFVFIG